MGFVHSITNFKQHHRTTASEAHWQSLAAFNIFRLLTVIALLVGGLVFSSRMAHPVLLSIAAGYSLLAIAFAIGIARRRPGFDQQLTLHVAADVIFIVTLIALLGGLKSGVGLLLLPYLAAAGLIAQGRMTLFHAALATIALLGEETYRAYRSPEVDYNFTTLALLCVAFFAVAWVAHRLARYAQESQKLAEQRRVDLAKLDRLNQRILQDVSDGVLVIDGKYRIRQFNQQAERLTGCHPTHDVRLDALLPGLEAALLAWHEDPSLPPPLLTAPGTHKLLRPRFVALSPGFAGSALIYLEDMDRLRREAQQIKLAALGRLTANLAHEIRNPLGAISHAAQLLAEESRDPLIDKLTRIIGENTQRLDRMVKDVLELNRRDRLQMRPIRLGEWLGQFLDEFSQVEGISAAIVLDCPPEAEIHFDAGHLHQVLWNLARNGWRYCSKNDGSLVFTVRAQGRHWRLDVCNDGPPVPAEAQAQLFEPFFTTDARGTGLGLYIAREICQANNAQIEYVSPPQGGACFRLTFGLHDGQKTR
ncbi:two-component system, NtrC family, sensor histidine kinase PilS [Formivibrio citricus]|uniref:histidine kinase n=1 Tax=Formivibrio citricus TaxID=83765 RepID=A0A1I5DHX0_9NEIS|nr:ATP-binding protein [Formivibrio citricus]SFN98865.1 two-component system, NtrC family, sensor histidine kinase PilS [Formivibrio citricus]